MSSPRTLRSVFGRAFRAAESASPGFAARADEHGHVVPDLLADGAAIRRSRQDVTGCQVLSCSVMSPYIQGVYPVAGSGMLLPFMFPSAGLVPGVWAAPASEADAGARVLRPFLQVLFVVAQQVSAAAPQMSLLSVSSGYGFPGFKPGQGKKSVKSQQLGPSSVQTASSWPSGSVKWKRRPPGKP